MRRVAGFAAALILALTVLVAGATPAQAACPTAGSTTLSPVVDNAVVTARTTWVDCGTYKRLQYVTFTFSNANVQYLKQGGYGNPGVTYTSGGNVFQAVNGYPTLGNGARFWLGNRAGVEPIQVAFFGRTHPGGTDFLTYRSF